MRRTMIFGAAVLALVPALMLAGCDKEAAPPSKTVAPAVPIPNDVPWEVYRPPAGCALDMGGAPRLVTDAATLSGLLVAHTAACEPGAAAARVDFGRHRLLIHEVSGAGFNPNTQETMVPQGVTGQGAEVKVLIDVPPNCGGAERGPGYLAIVLPVDPRPVLVTNMNTTRCDYSGGAPP